MKTLSGIDSLYYFCESNKDYLSLFTEIQETLKIHEQICKDLDVSISEYTCHFKINSTSLEYLAKAEGYYWFRDLNHFFKIGFKDPNINSNLHDIRVQLLSNGIYAYGIKKVLHLINDEMLKNYTSSYYPVTRADLNIFVTYDFSFIDRTMFATRKQSYACISEIGNSVTTETLYVGKPPFRLRIYNKRLEMQKKPSKFSLMNEYFTSNGIKAKQSLFNIEFEMHRTHLRNYKIDTIEDLLTNAEKLFKKAMDDIRLIDSNSLSDKSDKHHNKHRAVTLPVWEQLKDAYKIIEFLQSSLPLERIQRKRYMYELEEFEKEFKALTKRGHIHALPISIELLEQYYEEMQDDLKGRS